MCWHLRCQAGQKGASQTVHSRRVADLQLPASAAGLGDAPDDAVRIYEPLETVYRCRSRLGISRDGSGLNRVSVVSLGGSARVERSEGLRWDLTGYEVNAAPANALRNEFREDAASAVIEMAPDSPPVYVFHNRYEWSGA